MTATTEEAAMAAAATTAIPTTTTTAAMKTTTEATSKAFLETREAFCLDAAVSADMSNDNSVTAAPGAFASGEFSSSDGRSAVGSLFASRHGEQRVDVSTVLREMGEKNSNRKQLLLGRLQQQQQQKHRYRHGQHTGGPAGVLDNDYTGQVARDSHEKSGWLEGPEDRTGRWPSQQGGGGNTETHPQATHEGGDTSGQRLALAASVSTLSGMLVTLDEADPAFSCSDGSGSGKGRPFSGRMGGGGDGSVGAVAAAARRLGIPLLMVQSTEDALIGTPLALLLKQEVRFVSYWSLRGWACCSLWVNSIPLLLICRVPGRRKLIHSH